MGIDEFTGSNIRKYRKAHKMTLDELAKKIYKSKSTVSKYEKGVISLDITTLGEIANCLNVSPAQLIIPPQNEEEVSEIGKTLLEDRYMYSYDEKHKRIKKSLIESYQVNFNHGKQTAVQLFYDIDDLKHPSNCKALYSGVYEKTGFIETYTLQNEEHEFEYVQLCCVDSLTYCDRQIGLLSGLSGQTMLPVAIKVVLASNMLIEDADLIKMLHISKEDLLVSRKNNLFTLAQFVD